MELGSLAHTAVARVDIHIVCIESTPGNDSFLLLAKRIKDSIEILNVQMATSSKTRLQNCCLTLINFILLKKT